VSDGRRPDCGFPSAVLSSSFAPPHGSGRARRGRIASGRRPRHHPGYTTRISGSLTAAIFLIWRGSVNRCHRDPHDLKPGRLPLIANVYHHGGRPARPGSASGLSARLSTLQQTAYDSLGDGGEASKPRGRLFFGPTIYYGGSRETPKPVGALHVAVQTEER